MCYVSRWVAAVFVALLAAGQIADAEPEKPKLQLPKDPKPGQVFVNPVDGTELVYIPGGPYKMEVEMDGGLCRS